MKKITIILLTIISFSFQSNNIQDDMELICSGKWYIEYIEVAGKKVPLPPDMIKNCWAIFYADGNAEGMDQKGVVTKGKWEYLKEERAIKSFYENEIEVQKIVAISNAKLVCAKDQGGHEMKIGFTKR